MRSSTGGLTASRSGSSTHMLRLSLAVLLAIWVAAAVACAQPDPFAEARHRMVEEQIRARGVRSPEVLRAMREVPRHLFVPQELWAHAYEDYPLPIGYGQTISQPYIVAYMTEQLDVKKHHTVLEIGTGSGYQAAILAQLAREVYTIEIVPELAEQARRRLAKYPNVKVRQGDGYQGWPEAAPFDRIMLTAAPEEVPQELINQLKPGGKLIAPVGGTAWDQELVLIEKLPDGKLRRKRLIPVRFVPMVRGSERR